jgi:hypothetical protein
MLKTIHVKKCYMEVSYIISNGAGEEHEEKKQSSVHSQQSTVDSKKDRGDRMQDSGYKNIYQSSTYSKEYRAKKE